MTYIPVPDAPLVTPFGTFRAIFTDANTVRLLLRYEGADDSITVNGVEYHASLDLKVYDDNPADAPFSPSRTYYRNNPDRYHVVDSLHLKRVDNYKDASDAAKRKFLKVVTEAVNAFAVTDEGAALRNAGGERRIADQIQRKEREVTEAAKRLADLTEELDALRKQSEAMHADDAWDDADVRPDLAMAAIAFAPDEDDEVTA